MRQDLGLHKNVSAQIASAALRVDVATTPWTCHSSTVSASECYTFCGCCRVTYTANSDTYISHRFSKNL